MSLHQVGGSVPVRAFPAMLRVVSSWKALASPHLRAQGCQRLKSTSTADCQNQCNCQDQSNQPKCQKQLAESTTVIGHTTPGPLATDCQRMPACWYDTKHFAEPNRRSPLWHGPAELVVIKHQPLQHGEGAQLPPGGRQRPCRSAARTRMPCKMLSIVAGPL